MSAPEDEKHVTFSEADDDIGTLRRVPTGGAGELTAVAAVAADAGPLLIEDTDALMTAVWAEYLLGAPVARIERIAREHLADHYLLLTPETPWTDDGVRYAGDDITRQWFFDAARKRLDRWGAAYTVVSGAEWEERERQAAEAAEELLGSPV